MKTDFLGGSYISRSTPLSDQTLVNLFFEGAPSDGGSVKGMFYGAPGSRPFVQAGSGPMRGSLQVKGLGYVVSGGGLYSVTAEGAASLIGAVPGTGRVTLQNNDTQLAVMHSAGWSVLTIATGNLAEVPGAPTTAQGTFQDSYIVFPLENGTYGWTNIDDAQSLDALNFASAEAQPDPVISVLSNDRELWLFGTTTTQFGQTSGDPDLVFTITGTVEYGCSAKHTPAKSNNTIYWLGQNESGNGTVFMAQGYSPSRISTHALETAIAGYGDTSDAWGYCYQQEGHTFYVLTFPGHATWAYDASSQRWTQLSYLNPASGERERHRANTYMFLGGKHIVGDYATNNLYQLDLYTYTDNGHPIERERAWEVKSSDGRWMRHNKIEIMGEFGVGLDGGTLHGTKFIVSEAGQHILDVLGNPLFDGADVGISSLGADPAWELDWSDDGGRNWSSVRRIELGQIGHFRKRGIVKRLGISRQRIYRLRTSEPVKLAVYGANLDAVSFSR